MTKVKKYVWSGHRWISRDKFIFWVAVGGLFYTVVVVAMGFGLAKLLLSVSGKC